MITLIDIALAMGTPKSTIDWRELGWQPLDKRGNSYLFSPSILEEFRLAMSPEGKLGISWLPWNAPTCRLVLGWDYKPASWKGPRAYKARALRFHSLDNYYNPLEVKEYAKSRNRPFHFLKGYSGEARERWIEQIQIWEAAG